MNLASVLPSGLAFHSTTAYHFVESELQPRRLRREQGAVSDKSCSSIRLGTHETGGLLCQWDRCPFDVSTKDEVAWFQHLKSPYDMCARKDSSTGLFGSLSMQVQDYSSWRDVDEERPDARSRIKIP